MKAPALHFSLAAKAAGRILPNPKKLSDISTTLPDFLKAIREHLKY
ncbi:MAG: hypothetical protein LBG98_00630 [Puniceicoccales bacterium]|jgi:hypothetical protein|nr:hypothetical protein [Puniceicoccales bacterium]